MIFTIMLSKIFSIRIIAEIEIILNTTFKGMLDTMLYIILIRVFNSKLQTILSMYC